MTRRPSATKPANKSEKPPAPEKRTAPAQSPTEPAIAMTPRRGLFYCLLIVFVIWIGFLVSLYFTTVHHKTDVHEPGAASRALQ